MAIPLRTNDFGHFRVERGERQAWVLRAHCHECKETDDFVLSGGKSTLSQEWAERSFKGKKWDIGKDRQHDRCPKCIERELTERRAAQAKALAALPPEDIMAHDKIPQIPHDQCPRIRLNKPLDWTPTEDEIKEFMKDRQRAVGSDPKSRRDGLTYYPAITRGGENFVKALIETRISKIASGCFTYDADWDDHKVADLINKLYPAMHASYMMVRCIRTQWFGYAKAPKAGSARATHEQQRKAAPAAPPTAPAAENLWTKVSHAMQGVPEAAPEAAPAVTATVTTLPPPAPVSDVPRAIHETGHAGKGPLVTRLDRAESDLVMLYEEMERLKESSSHASKMTDAFSVVVNRISARMDAVERQVTALGKPAKGIEDYSISELLAEIARRTETTQKAG